MTQAFTIRSTKDGNFGQGSIPTDLHQHTDTLGPLFFSIIPEKKLGCSTYHQWYEEFAPEIKSLVDAIKQHPFWDSLRDGKAKCVVSMPEMDELYYSRTPASDSRRMMYGAAGNYDTHVDGIFRFPGIRVYRVLIGLTPNEYVETQFPRMAVSHRIVKNDFIVFDFDRARHQVVKLPGAPQGEYRILLKLHFCVSDKSEANSRYVRWSIGSYVFYETFTRWFMTTGTNPETLFQFNLGLFAQLMTRRPKVLAAYGVALAGTLGLRWFWPHWILSLLLTAVSSGMLLFFIAAMVLWLRYRLFRVR